MLTSALDATRAWSAGLNRLGWGCVSSLIVAWLVGMDDRLISTLGSEGTFGAPTLLGFLFLLLSSGLLGSIVISLGSLAELKRFSLETRIALAERVGRNGNSLLIQFYNEATFRFEMASGFRGTFLFGTFCLALKIMINGSENFPASAGPNVAWPASAGIIFAVGFDWLLGRSSTEAFSALEKVLSSIEDATLTSHKTMEV